MYRLVIIMFAIMQSPLAYCLNLSIPTAVDDGKESTSDSKRRSDLDRTYRPNAIKRIDRCIANDKPVVLIDQSYVYMLDIQSDGSLQSVNYQEKENKIAQKVAEIISDCGPFGRFPGITSFGVEIYSIRYEAFILKRKAPGVKIRIKYNN